MAPNELIDTIFLMETLDYDKVLHEMACIPFSDEELQILFDTAVKLKYPVKQLEMFKTKRTYLNIVPDDDYKYLYELMSMNLKLDVPDKQGVTGEQKFEEEQQKVLKRISGINKQKTKTSPTVSTEQPSTQIQEDKESVKVNPSTTTEAYKVITSKIEQTKKESAILIKVTIYNSVKDLFESQITDILDHIWTRSECEPNSSFALCNKDMLKAAMNKEARIAVYSKFDDIFNDLLNGYSKLPELLSGLSDLTINVNAEIDSALRYILPSLVLDQ